MGFNKSYSKNRKSYNMLQLGFSLFFFFPTNKSQYTAVIHLTTTPPCPALPCPPLSPIIGHNPHQPSSDSTIDASYSKHGKRHFN